MPWRSRSKNSIWIRGVDEQQKSDPLTSLWNQQHFHFSPWIWWFPLAFLVLCCQGPAAKSRKIGESWVGPKRCKKGDRTYFQQISHSVVCEIMLVKAKPKINAHHRKYTENRANFWLSTCWMLRALTSKASFFAWSRLFHPSWFLLGKVCKV